jgi:hypothetical protein
VALQSGGCIDAIARLPEICVGGWFIRIDLRAGGMTYHQPGVQGHSHIWPERLSMSVCPVKLQFKEPDG